jgi:zinc protease
VNYLEVALRGQNDEELAKDVLCSRLYAGHPYERHNAGTVSSLRALTVARLKDFYLAQFAQENLTLALGGGFPGSFDERVRRDFSVLPLKGRSQVPLPAAPAVGVTEIYLVEKAARGVAISLGFPIEVTRGHSDYPALLLAASALGQHRMSSGRLFRRMRQWRGLNYGDYAYIEHFPGGMYTLEPLPNVARSRPMFQLWVRPVDREYAHFALRLALYELERFVREGLTHAEFERARSFLSKSVNLLLKTKAAELGYAVDSEFYGTGPYPEYVRAGLRGLTLDDVNSVVRRHLRWEPVKVVMVGEGMAALRESILANVESPMTYNSPKPDEILAEDEMVMRRVINVAPEDAVVVGVEQMFA